VFFERPDPQNLDRRLYTKRPLTFDEELPQSLEHLCIIECNSAIYGFMAELFLFGRNPPVSLKTLKVSIRQAYNRSLPWLIIFTAYVWNRDDEVESQSSTR
jgi:hypothetical protein